MIFIKKLLVASVILLSITSSHAQIKNTKTETVKIYGNCGSCKKNIETAGNLKKVATVNWDKSSKLAVVSYDSTKTNANEILKRIALAGYDSDGFLAPTDAYSKLDACCQYDRTAKATTKKWNEAKMASNDTTPMQNMPSMLTEKADKTKMVMADTVIPVLSAVNINPLKSVFENYFLLKDALIQTSGSGSAEAAKNLSASLNAIKMDELSMDVHMVWMKVMKDLMFDAEHISETKAIEHQREHFSSLSKNMYALMKVSKSDTETFYQFCPMYNKGKGANWLSKDSEIKNPYYGSQMLSCGRTVETIK